MDTKQKDYLISENNNAWNMIYNIDERRAKFFQYFQALFGVLIIGSFKFNCSELLIINIITGIGIISILKSEREANIRYRKKINFIREIFLEDENSALIKSYKNNKKLGTLIYSLNKDIPNGSGKTLTWIYFIIWFEIVASLALYITISVL